MKTISTLIFILLINCVVFSQNGLVKTYHTNGIIAEENFYVKDVLDGISRSYYDNGVLKEEKNYMLGKLHGTSKYFYMNGKPKEEITIVDGKRDGITKEFYSNGGLKRVLLFEKGVLTENREYNYDPTLAVPQTLTAEEKYQKDLEDYKKQLAEYNAKVSSPTNSNKKENIIPPKKVENIEDEDTIFMVVEEQPEPIGGLSAIQSKLIYPELAKRANVEGTVIIKALINKAGNVEKTNVIKGIGAGCDEAAEKAISKTDFKPGMQRGKKVSVWVTLPVVFKLK